MAAQGISTHWLRVAIWQYNTQASEYNGQLNGNLVQNDVHGSMTRPPGT